VRNGGSGEKSIPFFAQRVGIVLRCLAADRPRRHFLVVDLARFLGKATADVLGVADDLAQLFHELDGEACQGLFRSESFDFLRFDRQRAARPRSRGPRALSPTARARCSRRRTPGQRTSTAFDCCSKSSADANQPSKRWPCPHVKSKMITMPAHALIQPPHLVLERRRHSRRRSRRRRGTIRARGVEMPDSPWPIVQPSAVTPPKPHHDASAT
jgi:hypothetical protein